MTNDMKDFPMQLRRNAAVCTLAAAIFHARGEVYGGNPDLTTAPPQVRDRFIQIAADVLDRLAPAAPAPASLVSLLEFAASLTRAQFGTIDVDSRD